MKFLLILLLLNFSLNADEMKRIESIVGDITKLRANYESCQVEAKLYEMQLKDEREKNTILSQELKSFENLYKREIEYKNRIETLENKIKEQNKLLKIKENNKKNSNVRDSKNNKVKEKIENNLINKTNSLKNVGLVNCEEPNPFPKLMMKKESMVDKKEFVSEEKIEYFKASSFRLNKNAFIYDSVNGKIVEEWERDRSFTSSVKTQNWTKITGYFVDRKWMRSPKDIWVKSSDVIKR